MNGLDANWDEEEALLDQLTAENVERTKEILAPEEKEKLNQRQNSKEEEDTKEC